MMLTGFAIANLKTIRDMELPLGRLTVLVGPNACGKSSVLQGIEYLCAMRETAPQEIFVESAALEHIRSRGVTDPVGLRAMLRSEPAVSVAWVGSEDLQGVLVEGLQPDVPVDLWDESMREAGGSFAEIADRMPVARSVRFEFDRLAAPAVIPNGPPALAPNGSGLAAVLANLALQYPSDFEQIKDGTISVIHALRDIRIRPATVRIPARRQRRVRGPLASSGQAVTFSASSDEDMAVSGHELIFDTVSGEDIPAHAMSDGTLRLLGLLTLTLGHNRPSLILLDDIERGMHPRAQYELIQLLRGALKEDPELQIVATTHSADLLDYLEPDEIRLLWLDEAGATQAVPMTQHPKYDDWKELMTPSELWGEIDRAKGDA